MSRRQRGSFAISMLCGIIGVLIAITLQLFNTSGILVDEFITGSITLREIQFGVIFIWTVIGIGLGVTQR